MQKSKFLIDFCLQTIPIHFILSRYICRSIEFDEETRQCILLEEDSVSQKDDITISSDYHHFFDLVCLDNRKIFLINKF